ncbi:MAG: dephospho-CoA kinase [Alphaproteobacteria bacterium]
MIVLGLTGSIGMGKSTAAAMLRRLGVPVHDADAAVHRLTGPGGGAVEAVGRLFPSAIVDDARGRHVDRTRLGPIVFADPAARRRLEGVLHPLVREDARRFVARHRRAGTSVVVLDIPLLYETGGERRVDAVVVVSAAPEVQARRVLARPGMTAERLEAIRRIQVPESVKRRRADYVVETGMGKHYTWCALARLVRALRADPRAAGRRHARNRRRYRNHRA